MRERQKRENGEAENERPAKRSLWQKIAHVVYKFLYTPCKEMVQTLCKKRSHNLRRLIVIQFCLYTLYLFSLEFGSLLYLYMLKVTCKT